jgi:hypothetical protein
VSKTKDPFNLMACVVGLTIDKGLAKIGRGIKEFSNYVIIYFNLAFLASRPLIESSRASPVALWILEILGQPHVLEVNL